LYVESALDLISLGLSLRDFLCDPNLANAGWLGLDALGLALPLVPALGSIKCLDDAGDACRKLPIPGDPFRGPNAPQDAFKHLEKYSGLDPNVVSKRLHNLKEIGELGPADDLVIGRTGDVYNAATGEHLGRLTDRVREE
jgi:hypothetical protein